MSQGKDVFEHDEVSSTYCSPTKWQSKQYTPPISNLLATGVSVFCIFNLRKCPQWKAVIQASEFVTYIHHWLNLNDKKKVKFENLEICI